MAYLIGVVSKEHVKTLLKRDWDLEVFSPAAAEQILKSKVASEELLVMAYVDSGLFAIIMDRDDWKGVENASAITEEAMRRLEAPDPHSADKIRPATEQE
jgi:hypothetical protein